MNSIRRNWIAGAFLLHFLLSTIPPTHNSDTHIYADEITNQIRHDLLADSTNAFLIDTSVVYGPAVENRRYPVVAFDGANYLVAWYDGRGSIYCTRISPDGEILDPAGIALSDLGERHAEPAVAFDGVNYLVVYRDFEADPMHGDISCTRVSQTGVVLDSGGIAISAMPYSQMLPSVTFGNTNYLVVWCDQFLRIYGARVSPDGTVLDTNSIFVADTGFRPSVAFDGGNYLVVWYDAGFSHEIHAARINQSGILLDSTAIVISRVPGGNSTSSVSFDGTNYLVVWADDRHQDDDIYGARVTPAGIVMDPSGFVVSGATDDQGEPKVAFDGGNYLVVWRDYRGLGDCDIYGARVTPTGTVLDPMGIPISTFDEYQWYPSVASGDTSYLVVWEDSRFSDRGQIFGSRITQEGIVVDTNGFVISTAANDQHHPSVSYDGTNYLVVWEDYLNHPSCEVRGKRVSESGVILDTASIAIANEVAEQTRPAVAYDGLNYFAVWEHQGISDFGILGARISQSGQVIDTAGIVISARGHRPSIAFDGINYFIVYQQFYSPLGTNIYGSLVTPTGVLLDSNIVISDALYDQKYPHVVFDGLNYLVVWQDHRNGSFGDDSIDIYGARVDQSGIVLDTAGIEICRAQFEQMYPDVAFDGMNYFAVWEDWGLYDYTVVGTRISQSGQVIDTALIGISPGGRDPRVCFDGTHYLVAWREYSTGPYLYDIYGARVDPTGAVIDSFPISTQLGSQTDLALAHGSNNQVLVAYSGWTDSINDYPAKTRRIWGTFCPPVGIKKETVFRCKKTELDLRVHPNPFTGLLNIHYSSRADIENAELRIYDACGRLIKEFEPLKGAQHHEIYWDSKDILGRRLSSGVYFLILTAKDYSTTKKLLLIR